MHTLLDYDCLLPELVNITDGKVSDNKAAFDIDIHPFIIVVADGGLLRLCTAQSLGQQQCILCGAPQGQYALYFDRRASFA